VPGDVVEGRGEAGEGGGRRGDEKRWGSKRERGRLCGTDAGHHQPTGDGDQVPSARCYREKKVVPSDRSSLLDCVLAYVNKAAVCSQGKRCAVQVCDFGGLGFS
jgi:hypothetical protein